MASQKGRRILPPLHIRTVARPWIEPNSPPHFEMKMGQPSAPAISNRAQRLAATQDLAHAYIDPVEVPVERLHQDPILQPVRQDNQAAPLSSRVPGSNHQPVPCREHRIAAVRIPAPDPVEIGAQMSAASKALCVVDKRSPRVSQGPAKARRHWDPRQRDRTRTQPAGIKIPRAARATPQSVRVPRRQPAPPEDRQNRR